MSVDYKLIGTRIKNKRKSVALTQEQMSELLHVSVGYVSQIERGYTKPNLEMLSSISEVLNCDIAELVSNVTIEKDSFLNYEINSLLSASSSRQKQIILEIAEIITKYEK